jgi:hypothetical protein
VLLNDMQVVERPGSAKFIKALASIASVLHPAYDAILPTPGKSRESCVLCSLTARDFLWRAGFKDARVTTVYLLLRAVDEAGKEIHSAGVGDHFNSPVPLTVPIPPDTAHRWNGHMVVEVPSVGYVLDLTLFHMKRPAWPSLPGMIAAPIEHGNGDQLAGVRVQQDDGSALMVVWLRQDNPRWRNAPDTERSLRIPVVKALVRAGR